MRSGATKALPPSKVLKVKGEVNHNVWLPHNKTQFLKKIKKFGKDAKSTFVGEGKMFRPKKKKKAMGGMKMKYGHGGRYSQHN